MDSEKRDIDKSLTKTFKEFVEEYLNPNLRNPKGRSSEMINSDDDTDQEFDIELEELNIRRFLGNPCSCGKPCQAGFTFELVKKKRSEYRSLSWSEKNAFMLSQLSFFSHSSEYALSGRQQTKRIRQRFDYRIGANREVCREVFLFYYGETRNRLNRLQKHFSECGISSTAHGNRGRIPIHAQTDDDKGYVERFLINFASAHGMPDPGRDLRCANGRLRIMLPTVLNYSTVHRTYQASLQSIAKKPIGYRSFIRTWEEVTPYIVFNKPRTDLCMQCENFKKRLNQSSADLSEDRDEEKASIHRAALEHLIRAKKERAYYNACIKQSEESFKKLAGKPHPENAKSNSIKIMQHYSWDFAQQFHYPYEDQQVGPIYFKTPRRAQLFGVCCEGKPEQINYLVDEADFIGKGANTVISFLDHFFEHHGLKEKYVYLTADNCVGQNKNNAVLQYFLYRILAGLHDSIELSFMLVGHTKFAPDGYFGLIRRQYRRSNVYTYNDLVDVVSRSSTSNHCQRYRENNEKSPAVEYRDWTAWLSESFKKLDNITQYRHFYMSADQPGIVCAKEWADTPEREVVRVSLLRKNPPFGEQECGLPKVLIPEELSPERQWYLYDNIRMHIPKEKDKDETCPQPSVSKPKKSKKTPSP